MSARKKRPAPAPTPDARTRDVLTGQQRLIEKQRADIERLLTQLRDERRRNAKLADALVASHGNCLPRVTAYGHSIMDGKAPAQITEADKAQADELRHKLTAMTASRGELAREADELRRRLVAMTACASELARPWWRRMLP